MRHSKRVQYPVFDCRVVYSGSMGWTSWLYESPDYPSPVPSHRKSHMIGASVPHVTVGPYAHMTRDVPIPG